MDKPREGNILENDIDVTFYKYISKGERFTESSRDVLVGTNVRKQQESGNQLCEAYGE